MEQKWSRTFSAALANLGDVSDNASGCTSDDDDRTEKQS
jgi:hypothetical protein